MGAAQFQELLVSQKKDTERNLLLQSQDGVLSMEEAGVPRTSTHVRGRATPPRLT